MPLSKTPPEYLALTRDLPLTLGTEAEMLRYQQHRQRQHARHVAIQCRICWHWVPKYKRKRRLLDQSTADLNQIDQILEAMRWGDSSLTAVEVLKGHFSLGQFPDTDAYDIARICYYLDRFLKAFPDVPDAADVPSVSVVPQPSPAYPASLHTAAA